jgi:hypothetical protein
MDPSDHVDQLHDPWLGACCEDRFLDLFQRAG